MQYSFDFFLFLFKRWLWTLPRHQIRISTKPSVLNVEWILVFLMTCNLTSICVDWNRSFIPFFLLPYINTTHPPPISLFFHFRFSLFCHYSFQIFSLFILFFSLVLPICQESETRNLTHTRSRTHSVLFIYIYGRSIDRGAGCRVPGSILPDWQGFRWYVTSHCYCDDLFLFLFSFDWDI